MPVLTLGGAPGINHVATVSCDPQSTCRHLLSKSLAVIGVIDRSAGAFADGTSPPTALNVPPADGVGETMLGLTLARRSIVSAGRWDPI